MELDTVELGGNGFEIFIKENDIVTPETLIAKMDLSMIIQKRKLPTVMTIVTTPNLRIENLELGKQEAKFKVADIV